MSRQRRDFAAHMRTMTARAAAVNRGSRRVFSDSHIQAIRFAAFKREAAKRAKAA